MGAGRVPVAAMATVALLASLSGTAAADSGGSPDAITPRCVPADPGYVFGPQGYGFIEDPLVVKISGQTGIQLTRTMTADTTITGTVSGQLPGDIGGRVAGAQVQVSASISLAKDNGVAASYSWTARYDGDWPGVGARTGYGTWSYGRYSCAGTWVMTRSGTFDLPELDPYSAHG